MYMNLVLIISSAISENNDFQNEGVGQASNQQAVGSLSRFVGKVSELPQTRVWEDVRLVRSLEEDTLEVAAFQDENGTKENVKGDATPGSCYKQKATK
ncbi:hypothetical protein SKAU_G00037530 [Synaphobranchus kaupii]|uniref:Uncharacterized protein n=1 Tax=Synaphobranchus kaupii TaxID=118154 RepID=A0A9Q1GGL6_SYNKA|nr:hypothetical protein SKAU_G00037530 [Synaphobranchus kaupii]